MTDDPYYLPGAGTHHFCPTCGSQLRAKDTDCPLGPHDEPTGDAAA